MTAAPMTAAPIGAGPQYPAYSPDYELRRWLVGGVVALFVLVGLSIFLSTLGSTMAGHMFDWSMTWAPWGWLVGLIGFVIAIWLIVTIVRVFVWSIEGPSYRYRHHRHEYRHFGPWPPFGVDPAIGVARERFARGEITKQQLDQISRDLGSPLESTS